MIDAVYAIIIVAFASLGALALFGHLVRGSELREGIAELRTSHRQVAERLAEVRGELEDLRFDTETMDAERVALERQTRCMLSLEEKHQEIQAATLEGDRSRRREAR